MARASFTLDEFSKLPTATPELALDMAKKFMGLFDGTIQNALEKVSEQLCQTHVWDGDIIKEALLLYKVETDPAKGLFNNEHLRVVDDTMESARGWKSLKVTHTKSTLADYEKFIAAMIQKFGRDAKFYVTSDRGDEYFILRTDGGE